MTDANGLAFANDRMDRIERNLETLAGEIPNLVKSIQVVSEKVDARFSESIKRADDHFNNLVDRQNTILQGSQPSISRFLTGAATVGAVVLSILAAFGSLAKTNVDAGIANLGADIGRLEKTQEKLSDTTVTRSELNFRIGENHDQIQRKVDIAALAEIGKRIDERHDNFVAEARRMVDGLTVDLRTLSGNLVSRDENKAHWSEIDERMLGMSNRINDIQKEYGASFTVGDQLKNLQAQLDQMRDLFSRGQAAAVLSNQPPRSAPDGVGR